MITPFKNICLKHNFNTYRCQSIGSAEYSHIKATENLCIAFMDALYRALWRNVYDPFEHFAKWTIENIIVSLLSLVAQIKENKRSNVIISGNITYEESIRISQLSFLQPKGSCHPLGNEDNKLMLSLFLHPGGQMPPLFSQ